MTTNKAPNFRGEDVRKQELEQEERKALRDLVYQYDDEHKHLRGYYTAKDLLEIAKRVATIFGYRVANSKLEQENKRLREALRWTLSQINGDICAICGGSGNTADRHGMSCDVPKWYALLAERR